MAGGKRPIVLYSGLPEEIRADDTMFQNPRIELQHSTNETDVWASTGTDLPWDTQNHIDTAIFTHSTSTNNDEITVDVDGIYNMGFKIGLQQASTTAGVGAAVISINGTNQTKSAALVYTPGVNGAPFMVQVHNVRISLSANDIIRVFTDNSSASVPTITSVSSTGFRPIFYAELIEET